MVSGWIRIFRVMAVPKITFRLKISNRVLWIYFQNKRNKGDKEILRTAIERVWLSSGY